MMWFVRFTLWLAALAWPCQLLAGAYQRLLIGGVAIALGHSLTPGGGADLAASNMLGIYSAMCLASTSAPRRARARALAIGLGALAAIELGTGLASVAAGMHQAAHGEWPRWVLSTFEALLAVPRFTTAPALWLMLLGPFELPAGWQARLGLRPAGRPGVAVR